MADIAAQVLSNNGLAPTWSNCNAGGDAFVNDSPGKYVVIFRDNAGSGGQVITAVAQNTAFDIPPYGDLTAANQVKTVSGANGTQIFHDLSSSVYNDGAGKVQFTYSAVANLQVAVIKVA